MIKTLSKLIIEENINLMKTITNLELELYLMLKYSKFSQYQIQGKVNLSSPLLSACMEILANATEREIKYTQLGWKK